MALPLSAASETQRSVSKIFDFNLREVRLAMPSLANPTHEAETNLPERCGDSVLTT